MVDTNKIEVAVRQTDNLIALSFELDDANYKGLVSLSGKINYKSGIWDGNGKVDAGNWIPWSAIKQKDSKEEDKKEDSTTKKDTVIGGVTFPLMAYGFDTIPEVNSYLIKGATVWTCDTIGNVVSDVLIQIGRAHV